MSTDSSSNEMLLLFLLTYYIVNHDLEKSDKNYNIIYLYHT